jgi:hypothetical protein
MARDKQQKLSWVLIAPSDHVTDAHRIAPDMDEGGACVSTLRDRDDCHWAALLEAPYEQLYSSASSGPLRGEKTVQVGIDTEGAASA